MFTFGILLATSDIYFCYEAWCYINLLLVVCLFVCLFVCERGILQKGIFKLKWAILTLSCHRAGPVSWRKWKLLDIILKEALDFSLLISLHHTAKILRWCHWKMLLKMCFHPEKSKGKSSICLFFTGSCCWHSELEGLWGNVAPSASAGVLAMLSWVVWATRNLSSRV